MGQEAEAGSVSTNREELFRSAYRSHYRSVLAYTLRRTAVRVDAEDVAAETFVAAWRLVDKLPVTEPDQLVWLYAVARRTLANHHRGRGRAARLNELLLTVDPSVVSGADDGVVDQSDLKVAVEALSKLSSKDQEILLLALWEDLSTREIATVMDLSRPKVSLRLHRAKRRLRDYSLLRCKNHRLLDIKPYAGQPVIQNRSRHDEAHQLPHSPDTGSEPGAGVWSCAR